MEYALQARSGQYPASQWEVKKTGKIIEINGVWGQSGIEIDHRSKGYVVIIPYYIYITPPWRFETCLYVQSHLGA